MLTSFHFVPNQIDLVMPRYIELVYQPLVDRLDAKSLFIVFNTKVVGPGPIEQNPQHKRAPLGNMLLLYTKNNRGPRIKPWGTPMLYSADQSCVLSVK